MGTEDVSFPVDEISRRGKLRFRLALDIVGIIPFRNETDFLRIWLLRRRDSCAFSDGANLFLVVFSQR